MNKKVIIGNFKMNLLPNEVVLYIENLKKDIKSNNEIVDEAREYINNIGGFEKLAEWGLY